MRAHQPRVEIDENRAAEQSVFVHRVTADVVVPDSQLTDLSITGRADEGIDEKTRVVTGLNVWRLWWI